MFYKKDSSCFNTSSAILLCVLKLHQISGISFTLCICVINLHVRLKNKTVVTQVTLQYTQALQANHLVQSFE